MSSSRAHLVGAAGGHSDPSAVVEVTDVVPGRSAWVRGPLWDALWMLSGLWLAPLVLWLSRGYANPEKSPLDSLYFGLTALFWIGHRLASTYVAFCTEAYRPLVRAHTTWFVVTPLLVTAGCFAAFLTPDGTLPYSREERLVGFAIIDYIFVTYHFAAQHFGALSLYRARVGGAAQSRTRIMDHLFAMGVGGVLVFLADILAGAVAYQDRWIDRWQILAWLVSTQNGIRSGAALVLVFATAAMLLAELHAPRPSLPRVLYIAGVAAMVALALCPRSPFLFLVVWTSQHWILATGLASQVALSEPAPMRGIVRRALHFLNERPWAIVLLLVLSSVVLLPLFEVEANRQDATYYGDRIFGAVATGLRTSSLVPFLLALGFASGFVHYLLDRGVYRLSDPRVRAAARGLLNRGAGPIIRET
jgi:hypothetical protein